MFDTELSQWQSWLAMNPFGNPSSLQAANEAKARLPKPTYPAPIRQALVLQERIMVATADPEIDAGKLAQGARAWAELQSKIMDLKGIGKPRPVTAVNDKPKGKAKAKPTEAQFTEPGQSKAE